ncbi:phytoene desaturase family protein [Terrisporobacter sp.]
MDKNVIIVGSGIGGICCGIYLLNKGFKVIIVEKNETLGGRINVINDKGFKFDLTASIIMTPKIYTDVFTDVGKNYKNYFQIEPLSPIYRVFYYDKTYFDFFSENNKMINELEKVFPGSSIEFTEFLSKSYKKYYLSKRDFLDKPMLNLKEIINLSSINSLIKINPLLNSVSYLSNIIQNEKIKNYLIFSSMYIGVNPYENSSIYTLVPAISHIYGLYYIKGGLYNYIKSLEKLFTQMGGKTLKNITVDKIIIDNNKIIGVQTERDVLYSDIVVCNADYSYAVSHLIDDKYLDRKYNKKDIPHLQYSCSVFILYLGLDKIYKNLKVHNIYICKDFKESIEGPFEGKIPKELSLYIYYPSIVDGGFRKNNTSSMNVMLRVPNLFFEDIKYNNKTIRKIRNKIIKTLKNIKGLEDIDKHIRYESYLTPKTLQKNFNAYYGNSFGLSNKLTQSIYFRPHIKSEKVKGLYFIGSSTHPGNGTSVVIGGSKLLSNLIENDYKK